MKKLEPIFSNEQPSGIYRFSSRAKPESIITAVTKHDWQGFHVDGKQISDKATFIKQFATSLSFPEYHGKNWDAFEECVTDMAWLPAPGYVLLYDQVRHFAGSNTEDWQIAQSILSDATDYWASKGKPMYILLRQSWWTAWDVPKL